MCTLYPVLFFSLSALILYERSPLLEGFQPRIQSFTRGWIASSLATLYGVRGNRLLMTRRVDFCQVCLLRTENPTHKRTFSQLFNLYPESWIICRYPEDKAMLGLEVSHILLVSAYGLTRTTRYSTVQRKCKNAANLASLLLFKLRREDSKSAVARQMCFVRPSSPPRRTIPIKVFHRQIWWAFRFEICVRSTLR